MRCLITLLEAENVKLAQDGLDFELRKKFKGMTFLYLYELSDKGNQIREHLEEEEFIIWNLLSRPKKKLTMLRDISKKEMSKNTRA